ncbi:MAG: hypothetical protein KDE22_03825 [Rhodobacterales bacterium]|nr:hypothetical protein [Rhodobacterales bacterium]
MTIVERDEVLDKLLDELATLIEEDKDFEAIETYRALTEKLAAQPDDLSEVYGERLALVAEQLDLPIEEAA